MKFFTKFKFLFFSVLVILVIDGCSTNEHDLSSKTIDFGSKSQSQMVFSKCPKLDWRHKKVEVSFEDAFQHFAVIEGITAEEKAEGHALTENNLKQGLTIKLKVTDLKTKSEQINEIMIEAYDLQKGINEFTIGYSDNKPYIIY